MRHILTKKVLAVALSVETAVLIGVLVDYYYHREFVDKLAELALYYNDMLVNNKIDLSDDYDLIALNAIADHPALRDFVE